jgi:hypothetical protein
VARRRDEPTEGGITGAPETDSAPAEGDSDSNEQSFSREYVEKIRANKHQQVPISTKNPSPLGSAV